MQLLAIVQQFCQRSGLARPANVAGSTDRMITQIHALLNEMLEDLTRWTWQQTLKEAVFTTTLTESQGNIFTLAPNFDHIREKTFFNRTQKLRVEGPLSDEEWQAVKATSYSTLKYYWRIQGDELKLTPTPSTAETLAFEYVSKAFVYNATDLEYKATFTKDNDEFLLDDRLISAALRWLWKKEKGFTYAEEFTRYEALAAELSGRSGGKKTLSMACDTRVSPGIIVPSGNWMQP